MTQAQDEHQLSPEKLQSPERIMSVRPRIIGRGVDNLEIAVAVGHATEEIIVEQQNTITLEDTRPAQAFAPISTDAVIEARKNLARIHGEIND